MTTLPFTVPDGLCELDVDLFGGETTSDLQTLEQDVLHTLLEWPGSNLDAPDRGIGIERLLSSPVARLDGGVASLIETQLGRDARITSVSAKVSSVTSPDGATFEIDITIAVGAATLGLSYAYSKGTGLVPQ